MITIKNARAVALSAGVMFFGMGAGGVFAQTVSIGTLPQGSNAYSIAAAVAKVIGDKTDLTTRAVGIGGSNIFIPQVNLGRIEMSTANSIEAIFARKGEGTFPGKPNPNLRMLARVLEFQTGLMVKRDSAIRSLADLKGKPFPSGFTAQKIVELLVSAAFAAEGMSWSDVVGVPVPNFVRATQELESGRVVGSFLSPGSGIVRKADASVGIRFLSFKESPAGLAAIQKITPGVYYRTIQPTPSMPYIREPVTVMAFDYVILVGAHVSDEVAYKAAKALHGGKKELTAAYAQFSGFDPKVMAKPIGVDYHPGAKRFYREAGLMTGG